MPALVAAAFSREILTLWVGGDFAAHAAPVMQWLALAVLSSAADAVVSGLLDSVGRPDLNAKFSLIELALYVPLLAVLLKTFGIQGAAIAWMLRVGLDLAARVALASHVVPAIRPILARLLAIVTAATLALALPLAATGLPSRVALMVVACAVYAAIVWVWGIDEEEKALCSMRLRTAP